MKRFSNIEADTLNPLISKKINISDLLISVPETNHKIETDTLNLKFDMKSTLPL